MPWLLWMVVVGGAIAAAVSLASRAQTQKAREAWAQASEQLGFTMIDGGHKGLAMAGSSGEAPVMIDVYQRGSGDSPKTLTRYRVELPPLGFDIGVQKKTGWHGVLQFFGAQDVRIGHDEFDSWFRLTTSNEARARRYLNPQRVAALIDLSGRYPSVALTDGALLLETAGIVADPGRIVATANALIDAGRVLAVPEDEAQYVLLGDRVPEKASTDRDHDMDRIRDTIEEYFETKAVTEEAAPMPAEATASRPPPAVDEAGGAAAEQIAADLFGNRQLGFESERRFEERYRDVPVRWSGTVQREGGLTASRVFGGGEHTLVEVNVATLQDDLYGRSSVDAVVAFPEGTPQPARGTTLRFSGTLIGIDPLTKDLYVAEGRID